MKKIIRCRRTCTLTLEILFFGGEKEKQKQKKKEPIIWLDSDVYIKLLTDRARTLCRAGKFQEYSQVRNFLEFPQNFHDFCWKFHRILRIEIFFEILMGYFCDIFCDVFCDILWIFWEFSVKFQTIQEAKRWCQQINHPSSTIRVELTEYEAK